MEQSVCTSLPRARAIVHWSPNSPCRAKAGVAKPSRKTPATADLMYVVTIVRLLGVGGYPGPTLHPGFRGLWCDICCIGRYPASPTRLFPLSSGSQLSSDIMQMAREMDGTSYVATADPVRH